MPDNETPEQRLKRVMQTLSLGEQEARFVIALADREIDGDIIDPDRKRQTLREVMIANGELKE